MKMEEENGMTELIETTVGRVIFNEVVPEVSSRLSMNCLPRRTLKNVIGDIIKRPDIPSDC